MNLEREAAAEQCVRLAAELTETSALVIKNRSRAAALYLAAAALTDNYGKSAQWQQRACAIKTAPVRVATSAPRSASSDGERWDSR